MGKGDAGAHLRPTPDRVRESLFNLLAHSHGDPVSGARVLDVFAGTGALGLEALSRGADSVVFLDSGRVSRRLISENIQRFGVEDRARLVARDALRAGPPPAEAASLVFLDPPYGKGLGEKALAALGGWIAQGALVVWEERGAQEAPAGFVPVDERAYGETHITILEVVG